MARELYDRDLLNGTAPDDLDDIAFGPATRARWEGELRHAKAMATSTERDLEAARANVEAVGQAHVDKVERRLDLWRQLANEYARYLGTDLGLVDPEPTGDEDAEALF